MAINVNQVNKTFSDILTHKAAVSFAEGERLNVKIIKIMKNGTIVRLSRHNSASSQQITVPQMLSADKVYSARIVDGKPVFTEMLRQNVEGGKMSPLIDTLLGINENVDGENNILSMLGGMLGLNNANRINKEENRRNCLSFSDDRGHYYFIFRLPTGGSMAKFVIRIDEHLNTVINIYTETNEPSCVEHLTERMRHIQSSLGTIVHSLNFAIFTDFDTFRTECETQFGLSNIDIMG